VEAQWSLRREQWLSSRDLVAAAVRTVFATPTVAGASATEQPPQPASHFSKLGRHTWRPIFLWLGAGFKPISAAWAFDRLAIKSRLSGLYHG